MDSRQGTRHRIFFPGVHRKGSLRLVEPSTPEASEKQQGERGKKKIWRQCEHLLEFSRLRKLHEFLRPVSLCEDRDGRRTRRGRAAAAATTTRDCGHYFARERIILVG